MTDRRQLGKPCSISRASKQIAQRQLEMSYAGSLSRNFSPHGFQERKLSCAKSFELLLTGIKRPELCELRPLIAIANLD
jgi:hypothetical protein